MDIPLWLIGADLLLAMVSYMTLWFALAVYAKRIDVLDAAWGLGFVYITILLIMLDSRFEQWQLLALLFVSIWGFRLFGHVATRLQRTQEDKRYQKYRKKWGESFLTNAYTNLFLVQGLLIIVVCTPVLAIILSPREPIQWLMLTGFAVWGFGILFETVADYQLKRFINQKAGRSPDDIMDKGLWHFSRHPNYFGEITAWWGAGIVAVSAGQWWGLIGPITITYLILKVSGIPPLEKRYENNAAYKVYKQKTSVLIPQPPKA